MKAYSLDLRQRIVAAVKTGESKASAASRFQVSYKTVQNYLALDAQGSLVAKSNTIRAPRKLGPDAIQAIRVWLEEKNDLTLLKIQRRLAEEFQIHVALPSIWKRLTDMKLTWKKNDPRRRTGAPRRPAPPGKLAGGNRRRASGKTGVP